MSKISFFSSFKSFYFSDNFWSRDAKPQLKIINLKREDKALKGNVVNRIWYTEKKRSLKITYLVWQLKKFPFEHRNLKQVSSGLLGQLYTHNDTLKKVSIITTHTYIFPLEARVFKKIIKS